MERKVKLCPIVRTPWGVQRSGYYGKESDPGHQAFGSRVGPCGSCPHQERGQSAAAPRRGIAADRHPLAAPTLVEGASGRKKQKAGGDAAGSEQACGAQPNPWREASGSKKIQCVKRLTGPGQVSTEFQQLHVLLLCQALSSCVCVYDDTKQHSFLPQGAVLV